MSSYRCTVEGYGRNKQPFKVSSVAEAQPGEFPLIPQKFLAETFVKLTEGRAEFGDLSTCQGPYQFTKMTIELVEKE